MNHSEGFHDSNTGFHSNDVESENNLIKRFLCRRYGKLLLGKYKAITNDTILDLYEYVVRNNVGDDVATFMRCLTHASFQDVVEPDI